MFVFFKLMLVTQLYFQRLSHYGRIIYLVIVIPRGLVSRGRVPRRRTTKVLDCKNWFSNFVFGASAGQTLIMLVSLLLLLQWLVICYFRARGYTHAHGDWWAWGIYCSAVFPLILILAGSLITTSFSFHIHKGFNRIIFRNLNLVLDLNANIYKRGRVT